MDQLLPFQDSTRVNTEFELNGVDLPTATQLVWLMHDTLESFETSYKQNLWMHHLNGDAAYLPL
jgi:hypothetical protein